MDTAGPTSVCVSGRWPKTLKSAITGTAAIRAIRPRRTQMSFFRPSRSRSRLRTMPPGTSAMRRGSWWGVGFLLAVRPGDEPAARDDQRPEDDEHDQQRIAPAAAAPAKDEPVWRRRDGVVVDGPASTVGVRGGERRPGLVRPGGQEPRLDEPAQQVRRRKRPPPDRGHPGARAG